MEGTPNPPAARPTTGQIISAYGLNAGEAEVLCCLLKGTERLQNYWRVRATIEGLIRTEEVMYYREL